MFRVRSWCNWVRDHRGVAAILFGALLPVLIGFAGVAVYTCRLQWRAVSSVPRLTPRP